MQVRGRGGNEVGTRNEYHSPGDGGVPCKSDRAGGRQESWRIFGLGMLPQGRRQDAACGGSWEHRWQAQEGDYGRWDGRGEVDRRNAQEVVDVRNGG